MGDESKDVKPQADSSSATSADASQHQQDVSMDSSVQAPSTQEGVKPDQSLQDFVKQTLGKSDKGSNEADAAAPDEDEDSDEKKPDESDSENESDKSGEESKSDKEDTSGEDDEDEEKDDEKGPGEDDGETDSSKSPVPYDRFKQVNEENKTLKDKVSGYEASVKAYNTIVEYCEQRGVTADEFNAAIEIQGMISSGDITGALAKLDPLVNSLRGYTGDKLPADLQSKVDDGKMELDDAKELAQLRAKSTVDKKVSQRDQHTRQQQAQARLQSDIKSAADAWHTTKRKSDPDYVEGSPKFESVSDRFEKLLNSRKADGTWENPVYSAAQFTQLLEKAYTDINGRFTKLTGKRPPTRPTLTSKHSSATSSKKKQIHEAGSMQEAVSLMLAQRK